MSNSYLAGRYGHFEKQDNDDINTKNLNWKYNISFFQQSAYSDPKPPPRTVRFFNDEGKPFNINQAGMEFTIHEDEQQGLWSSIFLHYFFICKCIEMGVDMVSTRRHLSQSWSHFYPPRSLVYSPPTLSLPVLPWTVVSFRLLAGQHSLNYPFSIPLSWNPCKNYLLVPWHPWELFFLNLTSPLFSCRCVHNRRVVL